MTRLSKLTAATAIVALLLGLGLLRTAAAQIDPSPGGFDASGGLLGGGSDASAGDLIVHATILPPAADRPARLSIAVDVPSGWHTYSITQPAGGPLRTLIKLSPSDDYRAGKFTADPPPDAHTDDLFPGVSQEEHTGHVTWTAPLTLRQGVDLSKLQISGSVIAQRCKTTGSCLPPKPFKFTATFAGAPALVASAPSASPNRAAPVEQPRGSVGQYQTQPPHSDAVVRGWIEPSVLAPGSVARVVLSIEPAPNSHVYALAADGPHTIADPTAIQLGAFLAGGKSPLKIGAPQADRPPVQDNSAGGAESVYKEPVRWTVDIQVPPGALGTYSIEGAIGYQTCTASSCLMPTGARFSGKLMVMSNPPNEASPPSPLTFFPASYSEATKPINRINGGNVGPAVGKTQSASEIASASAFLRQLRPQIRGTEPTSFVAVILYGLLGGLILNLMPCVLPVIGLKILGFVQQGGQSRARTLVLNIWYSLGLLLVFMVLATLAVNLQLKWGQQFQSPTFVVVLCGIVFVMALSFIGVWEIPIPGFVGSGKSAKLAAQEGAVGAFAKGVLTTILATPCSGPFLGAVFSYALTQSPLVTYIVFASIGLGMASPYLLIGAFPALVRFLPKPGAWMETFKQFMGFILLGTVVYLFSLLDHTLFVPALTLMIGLWAGCWWIGRTPLTANLGRKLAAWTSGAAIAAAVGWFAFTVLVPHPALLTWVPYSEPTLNQLLAENKTVMVDFTANWCPTCKFNAAHAINTERVKQVVQANGVVPMEADWSALSPEIGDMLSALHCREIPVLAIFPAGHPHEPIVLRDLVTQSEVVETLKEAGPSRTGLAAAEPPKH